MVAYQYELPFGSGKRFLSDGGVLGRIIGGWELNGVTSMQSGTPLSVGLGSQQLGGFGGTQRPNRTGLPAETDGDVHSRLGGNHASNRYLDPFAFSQPEEFKFGNVANYIPDGRTPPLVNWDLSIIKNISMSERFRLEVRGEFFNLWNNVNFLSPNSTFDPLTVSDPATVRNFGVITGAEAARIAQVGLKLYF